jgi:hypothetical protein
MYRRHAADLRGGRPCLGEHIVRDVGDVSGKALAHLQCHMGMETLSWALLGADVAGLDFSQPAIEKAELLRGELKLDAHFVCEGTCLQPLMRGVCFAGATLDCGGRFPPWFLLFGLLSARCPHQGDRISFTRMMLTLSQSTPMGIKVR